MQIGVYISDHPCRILIIVGPKSGKTNVVLNVMNHQPPHIDKIYTFVKYLFESKYYLEKGVFKQKRKSRN